MKKFLFVCRFSITFPELDADNPHRKEDLQTIYKQIVNCSRLWFAQVYEDYALEQLDYPDGLANQYQRTDMIYLYRNLNYAQTIPHIAKLCEGCAGLLALHFDAQILVDYPKSLPELCPPPDEE